MLRQGGIVYPEPQGAIEGLLYHWAPALITAPREVQLLARRYMFNLAAIAATLLSLLVSWFVFGTPATRPWIAILYFAFGLVVLLQPDPDAAPGAGDDAPRWSPSSPPRSSPRSAIGLLGPKLPSLGAFSLDTQTFVMLGTALRRLRPGDGRDPGPDRPGAADAGERRVQQRLSMNAPPATLMDELDRLMQAAWSERIPNRRYARIDPVTTAATPAGSFAGELFEESQPLPISGTQAPTFASALAGRRHRALLVLDLYATALVVAATRCRSPSCATSTPARPGSRTASRSSAPRPSSPSSPPSASRPRRGSGAASISSRSSPGSRWRAAGRPRASAPATTSRAA